MWQQPHHHQQLMNKPVPRQQLGMAGNPMQQLTGSNSNSMLNSTMNPWHTPMHHQMTSPVHDQMVQPLNSASDENVIMKQVLDAHLPDGTDVDVKPILHVVEDILKHANPTSTVEHTHVAKLENKPYQANAVLILKHLAHIIDKLASEMSFMFVSGGDGHTTAISLIHTVGNFHWEAKLVLTLSAFAQHHGRFLLLTQIRSSSNQLGRSMAMLRRLPVIMEHPGLLKPRFDPINKLICSVLELTECIIHFKDLPAMYISYNVPAMASATSIIPTAVYWNIRGIIGCAAQITCLSSMGHEYGISPTELPSWELPTLNHKIDLLLEHLRKQLENCHRVVGDRKEIDFRNSYNQLFETIHIDNMKILRILVSPRDDILPLYDGNTKQRVKLEVLRRRNVLLLISGLDMSHDELSILEKIYSESRIQGTRMDALYEVVWMPIVDPSVEYTEAMDRHFEEMRNSMPWYSVYHPSIIDMAVKRSIGDRWHFRKKPIVVVLDPQGRELSPNAIHMMWIWGSNAFPFTRAREEALWKEETWRLELLLVGGLMDPTILNWIRDDKYIFLYGGDDIEWIRKFTNTARALATAAHIPLEMAYVGKSKNMENVRRAISTINQEKLSYCWQDTTLIWLFWTHIESMLLSKIQLRRADDQDHIMLQIKKLLSYDKDGSWALFCKGSEILTNGHGSTVLQTHTDVDLWKEHIPTKGFDNSFVDYHDELHVAANNCCRFEFPITVGRIPEGIRCPECHHLMEKYIVFLCCHDQTGLL